jgi:DNA polymerase-3 subunit chi
VTEIDIHHGLPDKLGYACRLLRKMTQRGARALVLAEPGDLDRLDRLLWTFSSHDFIAHCKDDAPDAMLAASPIVLARCLPAALPGQDLEPVLVNLGRELPAGFERHQRLIDLVGQDETDRAQGRLRWKFYKARGYPLKTYDKGVEAAT